MIHHPACSLVLTGALLVALSASSVASAQPAPSGSHTPCGTSPADIPGTMTWRTPQARPIISCAFDDDSSDGSTLDPELTAYLLGAAAAAYLAARLVELVLEGEPGGWRFRPPPFADGKFQEVIDREGTQGALAITSIGLRAGVDGLTGFRASANIIGNNHTGGGADIGYFTTERDGGRDSWFGQLWFGYQFYPTSGGWIDLGVSLGWFTDSDDTIAPGFFIRVHATVSDILHVAGYVQVNVISKDDVRVDSELTVGHLFGRVEVRAGVWLIHSTGFFAGPTLAVTVWI